MWRPKPEYNTRCRICGQPVKEDDSYEAVKPKGKYPVRFMHASCIKPQGKEEEAANE